MRSSTSSSTTSLWVGAALLFPAATHAVQVGASIAAAAAAAAAASSGGPVCPDPEAAVQGERFHTDRVCNRAAYNDYKAGLNRHLKYQAFKSAGGIAHIPNQKTAYCPLNPQQFHAQADSMTSGAGAVSTGMDTVWIVENVASTPVVISYLNSQGIEVSARNGKISPPERDPNTILQPHQWMAVNTFEGHVFYAREYSADTGTAGDILLQHRVGLIPVGAGFESYNCPETDIEPIKEDGEREEEYQRTPSQVGRPCNTVDIGFRNMVGCPLHGFFVQPAAAAGGEVSCQEDFKFHLGVEDSNLPDFMWDWTSETKFEGTFMGHTFNFRLAHNPAVLVESVTLQPTQVTDCPELKQKVSVRVSGDGIIVPVGLRHPDGSSSLGTASNNTTGWFNNNTTTTTTTGSASRAGSYNILS